MFLTNWRGAENKEFIKNNNITHIINVNGDEKPLEGEGIIYKNINNISDNEDQAEALQSKF